MTGEDEEADQLVRRAAAGDKACWGALLALHEERLRHLIGLRLDRRLKGRIDPADVLQETYLEALARLPEYLNNPPMPFFLWLRFLTGQKLMQLHRHHLGARMRAAGREVSLYGGALPETSSAVLAARLVSQETRPSAAAIRAEMKACLQQALDRMDPLDREVLALRHFEQLTNAETARVLSLHESAASKRYVRALKRLKDILSSLPGGPEEV
jgi:RNA polymerase sigma-70 factor (ECF subfamily)